MAVIVAVVAVAGAQRHPLKECMKAQANHQTDRQPGATVSVSMAMLNAPREELKHYLGEKTGQNECSKICPPVIANEDFWQEVQRSDRQQVRTTKGDQQLELGRIRRFEQQYRNRRRKNRKYEKRVGQSG